MQLTKQTAFALMTGQGASNA